MRRSLPLIVALGLVAAACSSGGGGGGGGNQPPPEEEDGTIMIAGEEAEDHGTVGVVGNSFELEVHDNYFAPTVLKGQPGETLVIELHNEGAATHTFTIEDQGLDAVLEAAEDVKVEVQFPDDGATLFVCRFHESQGMRGGLSAGGSLDAASASAASGSGSKSGAGKGDGGGGYGYG